MMDEKRSLHKWLVDEVWGGPYEGPKSHMYYVERDNHIIFCNEDGNYMGETSKESFERIRNSTKIHR